MRVKIKYECPGHQKSSSSELYGRMSNGKSNTKRTHKALCDESVSAVGVLEWLMFAFE